MAKQETLEEYVAAREQFEAITLHAMELSEANSGRKVDSWRPEYGSQIFAKLVLHAMSALILAPDIGGRDRNRIQVWDPSSLAALVRALIDTYFVFYYVACDEVDKDESEFRYVLWHYHGEKARLKKLNLIKSTNPKLSQLQRDVDDLKRRVTSSAQFTKFDKTTQKAVRQGRYAFLATNSELSERAGFSPDHYKSTYDFLSSYIHTLPFSLSQLAGFYSDQDARVGIYKLILDHGSTFLAQAVTDFVDEFGDSGVKITPEAEKAISIWQYILLNIDE